MQKEIYINYLYFLLQTDFKKWKVIILSGLPGSGKSSLGEILRDEYGYEYLSSDVARAELLKLTKGKFATTSEYLQFKNYVYTYLREKAKGLLKRNKFVVLDATHMNEQLDVSIKYFEAMGVTANEMRVIYVDGGDKNHIRKRFTERKGQNADGRKWEEAWETAYDYFAQQIKKGKAIIPENLVKGCKVIWVANR